MRTFWLCGRILFEALDGCVCASFPWGRVGLLLARIAGSVRIRSNLFAVFEFDSWNKGVDDKRSLRDDAPWFSLSVLYDSHLDTKN